MKKFFPFLNWFPMSKDTFKADCIAGLTVALLLIPQSMAYAELAGLPPYYGLYGAFIPVMIGAMFGSLGQLGTGPVAMTSILTAAALAKHAAPGTNEYIQMAILLALIVGIIRLLVGAFKLAFLFNFVSHPVIAGFTNAAAIIIGFSQVSKIFGIQLISRNHYFGDLRECYDLILSLGQTHIPTLIMGISAIIAIGLLKKYLPRIPSVLVVVVFSTVISYFLKFGDNMGGIIVGEVPKGLPAFMIPRVNGWGFSEMIPLIFKMLPDALVVSMIGFMEVASVSKTISLKLKKPLNLNQELIGQGVSAISGSFFQSYPTSGSFSRSAMNLMMGAKTGFSSVVTGLVVMILLLFFTPLLYHLPKAVLAASIIMAVQQLVDWKIIKSFWKLHSWEGFIAIFTFSCTIATSPNMTMGLLMGVIVSISGYLIRTMRPRVIILGYSDEQRFRNVDKNNVAVGKKIVGVRIEGSLYFANMEYVEERLLNCISHYKDLEFLIIDAIAINRIDASCAIALGSMVEKMESENIEIVFGGVKSSIRHMLEKSGMPQEYREQRLFRHMKDVVKWISKYAEEHNISLEGEPFLEYIG